MLRTVTSTFKQAKVISFRRVLVIPFLLQVSFAVGITGYISIKNAHKSAENFAVQLQADNAYRIDQRLNNYLSIPHRLTYLNHHAIQAGLLDPNNLHSFEPFFLEQMRQFPEAGYINFGKISEEFVGIERREGQLLIADTVMIQQKRHLRAFTVSASGKRDKLLEQEILHEPLAGEGWFRDAIIAKKPIWSSVYKWDGGSQDVLSISASHPVYDTNNRLIGVVGVDLILNQVSDFLGSLKISPNGRAFVMERDGLLIASSSPMALYQKQADQVIRLNAIDAPDPLIRSSAHALQKQFGHFKQIQDSTQFKFQHQGKLQFAYVFPWKDRYGLDWLIVVAAPASDFTDAVNANTQSTLVIGLIALGLATLFGMITAHWMARPILHLSQAAQSLSTAAQSEFKDSDRITIPSTSPILEVNWLTQSFQSMALQLRKSFQDLAISKQTLEQVNLDLEAANTHLEERVAERTQELSQALDRLQQAQVQMVQTEKMSSLGQMVAGVAHEINNPVNFIHANLHYTSDYALALIEAIRLYQQEHPNTSEQLQDYLTAIDLPFVETDLPKLLGSMKNGTERIQEIVNGLKTFSRLDEAEMKTVNLRHSINSTLMLLQHRLAKSPNHPEIQVVSNFGSSLETECYAGQMNQVFFHILNNAIDAILVRYQSDIQTTQPTLPGLISITTTQDQTNLITLAIKDNGIGMTPDIQGKIFDPFFTTKPVGQGVGLSLSIDYQIIVERHSGRLTCHSIPGEGSEFIIQIPLQQTSLHDTN